MGDYTKLKAVEPLAIHRKRPPRKGPRPCTSLDDIVAGCAFLSVTCQLAVWLMRLVGLRIGEAYGLFVSDYQGDGTRAWLRVETQGGKKSLARDKEGRFVSVVTKEHTKTVGSTRKVPICRPLADLIAEVIRIYHTDPVSGQVNTRARLIPGLRSEDASGIAARGAGKSDVSDSNRLAQLGAHGLDRLDCASEPIRRLRDRTRTAIARERSRDDQGWRS